MYDPKIQKTLESLQIDFKFYEHPAFPTCESSHQYHQENQLCGLRAKNIFLRNKNGKKHFLLVLPHKKYFEKDAFRKISGEKCSFASNKRLMKYLQVKPGSVSPLSLVHDTKQEVFVYLDADLMKTEKLHFHPGINTQSVEIAPRSLLKYLRYLKIDYQEILFPTESLTN